MDDGINVLSFFDGLSCGRIALERIRIKVKSYHACEIDKYAMKVSAANYPDIIQHGSVTDIEAWMLPKIDLFIGGSPCQGFSFAGKQLNFKDPRSMLFFEYARVLKELRYRNPNVKFWLENVVMKKEYQDIISDILGVQPILINSALVSAQNRKRLYWTNLPGVTQPFDKSIILSDILLDLPFDRIYSTVNTHPSGRGTNGKIRSMENKSPCLTTNKGEGIKVGARLVGRRKNEFGIRCDDNKLIPAVQTLEINGNPNKSNCLTTVEKDNYIANIPVLVGRSNKSQDGKIVSVKGKSYCHTAGNNNTPKVSEDGIYYRKLTPVECERLQTVPDNFTVGVSNSQRYRMLGNGWTIDVIVHLLTPYAAHLEFKDLC